MNAITLGSQVRNAVAAQDLGTAFRLSPRDIRKLCADSRCAYLAAFLATAPSPMEPPPADYPQSVDELLQFQARLLFRWRVAQLVGSRLSGTLMRRAALRAYRKGMRRERDRIIAEWAKPLAGVDAALRKRVA